MNVMGEIRHRFRSHCLPMVLCLVVVYFGYHGFNGDRGIFNWLRLKGEIKQATLLKNKYQQERIYLEKRVKSLSPQSIDPDLLDEQSRKVLNMGQKDEFVILLPNADT